MFQNLSRIREDLGSLDFPDISKQALSKLANLLTLPYLKSSTIYQLIYSISSSHLVSFGMDIIYLPLMVPKLELPNSKSNFEFFGEMFGYPDPSRRFTMGLSLLCRASAPLSYALKT